MSQHPRDAQGPEQGTFVGSSFGSDEDTQASVPVEDEHQDQGDLADAQPPGEEPESAADPVAGPALAGDVEGIATEPAPGDRNEPV
ncbi:hypothetical protein [Serinicoccus sp. CNJ-927]|uniref:hypothetical protein n=1 Tax=Serinicoccus sp. CNJ-927 TaxID=1904970 RepID=UPI00096ACB50|nr:hypothetical protein [Serinicoccus sp. CNJ-927]